MKITKKYLKYLIKEEISLLKEERFCTKCGIAGKPGSAFCMDCGNKFKEPPPQDAQQEELSKKAAEDRKTQAQQAPAASLNLRGGNQTDNQQGLSNKQTSEPAKKEKVINTGQAERRQTASLMDKVKAKYEVTDLQNKEAYKSLRADAFKALKDPEAPAIQFINNKAYRIPKGVNFKISFISNNQASIEAALKPYEKYVAYKLTPK